MYVVTFYSSQGGAGRTTALVNVAIDLASRGRKVLLVDFDLAKPTLAGCDPLRPDSPRPGLVEFITEYLHLGRPPVLEEYVYQAKVSGETRGKVWVMPAGRADDGYWESLARLNWQDLYAVRDGFRFMEDLKEQWRNVLQPDYVLIDAQAGIHDTTGVCTRQLADDVVFLIVPDQSDLMGMNRVMQEVFAESVAEEPYRIDIHLVTSKVPNMDGDELPGARPLGAILEPDWAINATTGVGIQFDLTAELPYDPALLLERQIVMSRRPGSRLAHQYRELANAILRGNCTRDRDGARAFLKELQRRPELAVGAVGEWESTEHRRWFDRSRRLEQIIESFTAKRDEHDGLLADPVTARRDAEVLGQAASCLFLAGAHVQAADVVGAAVDQSPTNPVLLWQQASYRLKAGDSHYIDDLMTLLDQPPPARTPEEGRGLFPPSLLFSGSWLPELDTQPLRHDVLPLETASGLDKYLVSAVRLLRQRAPERLEEALQKRRVQSLSESDRERLLWNHAPNSAPPDQGPEWLIRWKHFREAISQLAPIVRGASDSDVDRAFYSAFHLAMAYWGAGEEAEATRVSQEALQPYLKGGLQERLDSLDPSGANMVILQAFALLAFRAGNLEVARAVAFRLVGDLGEHFQGTDFFSFWRYQSVRFSRFREDCRDLRLMIQQRIARDPVRLPPFLSKALNGA